VPVPEPAPEPASARAASAPEPGRAAVRRLGSPRWVALHALALALVVTFVLLGLWQLGRARAMVRPVTDADPAPVALAQLSPATGLLPDEAVGRRVFVHGEYDQAHGFVVPDRTDGAGRNGVWLVGLLRLDDGSGVLVLRGWAPDVSAADRTPGPSGPVTVTGRLQLSESPDGGLPPGQQLAAGQLAAVNPVDLLDVVPYDVHDGYLVADGQTPADPAAAALTPVTVDPPGSQVPGFLLQHVGYVALWWLFALFVVAFWWRLLRDELHPPSPEVAADPLPTSSPTAT
jgi:cytochrome oxidase assembly protein ShyY1